MRRYVERMRAEMEEVKSLVGSSGASPDAADRIGGFVRRMINEKEFGRTQSVWASLPFNYRIVPTPIRNALMRVLLGLKAPAVTTEDIRPFVEFLGSLRALDDSSGQRQDITFTPRPILVLSHDVEGSGGFEKALDLAAIEERFGFRSTWFVVTGEYAIDHGVLEELGARGHRIGWHEYRHDNRFPFLDRKEMLDRMARSEGFFNRYNVGGFRSPSYLFSDAMFEALTGRFAYDSSRLDYDVISGKEIKGCFCPYPYFRESGLLELPVTIPFEIPFIAGKNVSWEVWRAKTAFLLGHAAMVHINTHPDPHYSGTPRMMDEYGKYLAHLMDTEIECVLADELAETIHDARN